MASICKLSNVLYNAEKSVLGSHNCFFRVFWVENAYTQTFADQMVFDLENVLKPNMVPHFNKFPVIDETFKVQAQYIRKSVNQLLMWSFCAFAIVLEVLDVLLLKIAVKALLEVVNISGNFEVQNVERLVWGVDDLSAVNVELCA